ncbi:DUF4166 domain-containing protein [Haloarcula salinisoli]|uniref:DUF4166 domain-containing protein n=1 Tax=Haloarcula salinisoli TaxID=2487746 RepID=A0A8J7YGY1_9EURY|nr:DUF4166 domain-containing protein [Halomicroarcula salinisoli]MBX0285988.1 DUF4166 domain-containing protein [Halomicroarcula salinisoli]MBX0302524.1 DUF4166 domain-containing protein [Halomicroarcula salinisoli]
MNSVYERALGPAYDELHPAIAERYALTSADRTRCVGRGRMYSVRHNPLALPVLWAGTRRNLLFPEQGAQVPFEVRTTPFDDDGVETVAYVRQFDVGRERRFDAYMRYDEARDCVVDALGTHRNPVTELQFSVTEGDALRIGTGAQWLRLGDRQVPVPRPLRADVTVVERYDDERDRFEISVAVANPVLGPVFAYDGWFTVDFESVSALPETDAPADRDRG